MDLTFITIHGWSSSSAHRFCRTNVRLPDLTLDARILYSSDSIVDVLGYTPDEVVNHSTWEYFPPEELPYARKVHKRGIAMDKAAVLSYCRVKNRQGDYVGCECCFTIVYDVMIVCTSVYRWGLESQSKPQDIDNGHHKKSQLIYCQSEPKRHLWSEGSSHRHQRTLGTTCCHTFRRNSSSQPNHSATNLVPLCSSIDTLAH